MMSNDKHYIGLLSLSITTSLLPRSIKHPRDLNLWFNLAYGMISYYKFDAIASVGFYGFLELIYRRYSTACVVAVVETWIECLNGN
jgi:hypothetical protein